MTLAFADQTLTLGVLADPRFYTDPLNITSCETTQLLIQLRKMLLIRHAEDRIGKWVEKQRAKCPCHLGIGQEAIATGVAAALRSTDRVFGTHRSHSHFLALGGCIDTLMAEVLGKVTGCSQGMGGSMHLFDAPHGFLGSVPIVGATIPLAAGAALAAKKDGYGDVAVTFFGDGAAEEGVIHETMNLAATFRLPLIFICENNLFASHLHIDLRQPSNAISRFAQAHCIPFDIIDGNDVVAVTRTAQKAVQQARKGDGPFFIEAVTYRWRGHVGPSEDTDVGVQRNSDLPLWKKRDPIQRLANALALAGIFTVSDFISLTTQVQEEVNAAALEAENAEYPPIEQLLSPTYYSTVKKAHTPTL